MKINGNAIRQGNIIEFKGELYRAVKTHHTQPGKGGAYLQVELKSVKGNTKLNERFRAAETVERAVLEQKSFQFLYKEDDMYTFMDGETYEQINLSAEDIGEVNCQFLQDGMQVEIEMYEDTPLGVRLPDTVILEVMETEPVVKGQTAAHSNKPAKVDNGMRIMVPPFINVGDKIVVTTEDVSYNKRTD
jgi:elongation factor P